MNRIALTALLCLSAPALAAPKVATKADPQDIAQAKLDKASLFNRADALIQTSDTGGHIATVVDRQAFTTVEMQGQQATVQVEVTDPFGYYNASSGKAPQAILANAASKSVIGTIDPNHNPVLVKFGLGQSFDLGATGFGAYRGSGSLVSMTGRGDLDSATVDKVGVSMAGQKGWNSRYGRNYPAEQ